MELTTKCTLKMNCLQYASWVQQMLSQCDIFSMSSLYSGIILPLITFSLSLHYTVIFLLSLNTNSPPNIFLLFSSRGDFILFRTPVIFIHSVSLKYMLYASQCHNCVYVCVNFPTSTCVHYIIETVHMCQLIKTQI